MMKDYILSRIEFLEKAKKPLYTSEKEVEQALEFSDNYYKNNCQENDPLYIEYREKRNKLISFEDKKNFLNKRISDINALIDNAINDLKKSL